MKYKKVGALPPQRESKMVRQIVKDAMKVDEFAYKVECVWLDNENLFEGTLEEVDEKFDDQQIIYEMEWILDTENSNLHENNNEVDLKVYRKNIRQTKKFLKKYSP